jgi:hypothetical protein
MAQNQCYDNARNGNQGKRKEGLLIPEMVEDLNYLFLIIQHV